LERLKLMSLFSGIGAFEKSLTNLNIDYKLVGFSEIDKYAIKSYCAIHNVDESLNLGDISKINKTNLPEFDILVGGSPCQSFSVAGARKGFEDTRGTLFFQYVETLKCKQPKYFVYENVKGLINHDKGKTLDTITQSFDEVGYRIDLELLNSKYFNVPQNRERIYILGIREDLINNEEWIIDEKRNGVLIKGKKRLGDLAIKTHNFKWPKQKMVSKRLRDILEDNVGERYYLSEEKTAKLVEQLEERNQIKGEAPLPINRVSRGPETRGDSLAYALKASAGEGTFNKQYLLEDSPQMLGLCDIKGNESVRRVYSADGISPTLTTMGGGHREPKIAELAAPDDMSYCIDANYAKGISPGGIGKGRRTHVLEEVPIEYSRKTGIGKELDTAHTLSASDWRGLNRNQKQNAVLEVRPCLTPDRTEKRQEGRRFKENDDPAFTINTIDRHGVAVGNYPKYRIRKLIPLECFRLQAFSDEDFQKCVDVGISNSQLYKQAGNSITVTVLEEIFAELLSEYIPDKNYVSY
jgi:DNA (cytosine-5)-methyltransferase 1